MADNRRRGGRGRECGRRGTKRTCPQQRLGGGSPHGGVVGRGATAKSERSDGSVDWPSARPISSLVERFPQMVCPSKLVATSAGHLLPNTALRSLDEGPSLRHDVYATAQIPRRGYIHRPVADPAARTGQPRRPTARGARAWAEGVGRGAGEWGGTALRRRACGGGGSWRRRPGQMPPTPMDVDRFTLIKGRCQ